MKKVLTAQNFVRLLSAIVGVVAFFFMFGDQLYRGNTNPVYIHYQDVYFGDYGTVVPFLAYLLILILVIVMILNALIIPSGPDKIVQWVIPALLVVSAILIVCEGAIYTANASPYGTYHLAACAYLGACFAIVSAGLYVWSNFIHE